ncbi:hypothetical protein F383_15845 [Gossypium arboreum]|uniref:Uncharacterized protein n=1 Tax=Gossypium arboreum TaxID=29729 RepID=A0A0B0PLZ0_GOSAR|nr:hypothetical protein F383_15842 [Gossypium arboreum]KHG27471.1 hypothetical protein F383_15843 [Gossypium arboreum]KHG27473.1 hypothetical protein F383_15845 [Gossypium arboreum]
MMVLFVYGLLSFGSLFCTFEASSNIGDRWELSSHYQLLVGTFGALYIWYMACIG